MTNRELMVMALKALESSRVFVTTREKIKHPEGTNWYDECITALRDRLAQPDPEPVAFGYLWPTGMHPEFRYTQQKRGGIDGTPVYTVPPRRKWQGLTPFEITMLWKRHTNEDGPYALPYEDDGIAFARAIEAALRERNT